MQSLPSHTSSDANKNFIDKVISGRERARRRTVGHFARKSRTITLANFCRARHSNTSAEKANVPLIENFQRRHVLRAVQSRAAGPRHRFRLPRHRLPHPRLARPARTSDDELGLPRRGRRRDADKLSLTTPDGETTLRTVACFGQCALAPVVEVDHAIFGHMNERTLQREMEALDKESRGHERIRDLSTFNAVRSAGLAKLLPVASAHRRRHGHLRLRQRRRGRLPRLRRRRSPSAGWTSARPIGCFGFCAEEPLVNVWMPGQPLLMLHRVQPTTSTRSSTAWRRRRIPRRLALCKIEEWDHLTGADEVRHRLPGHSRLERDPVLQRPGEDRPAQLRPDQPGRHRGVHRASAATRPCTRC